MPLRTLRGTPSPLDTPEVPEKLPGIFQNEKFQTRLKTFTGWTAQIIQHEIDHCEGIII